LANAPAGSLLHRVADPGLFGPSPQQQDGSYFIDVNPLWLSVVIDYLAHAIVTAPKMTPGVLSGVQAAADYLGIDGLALVCAARLAQIEAAEAPAEHRISVLIITAADRHAYTGALDVFSQHKRGSGDWPLTVTFLRHHPINVVGHTIHEALGCTPHDAVLYGCCMRRNTTLRPLASLNWTASTPLVGCWAERDRQMWICAFKRTPQSDMVPAVSCDPPAPTPSPDAPMLIFVKVFDPSHRYLSGPFHTFVSQGAMVRSALPLLLDAAKQSMYKVDGDNVAVYDEATKTNAYAVDLDATFAQGEIETGDVLWLCRFDVGLGPRVVIRLWLDRVAQRASVVRRSSLYSVLSVLMHHGDTTNKIPKQTEQRECVRHRSHKRGKSQKKK
jgi:hypothetical protein